MTQPEFTPFPKLARLNRDIYITEKIDGTNAAVVVSDDDGLVALSGAGADEIVGPGIVINRAVDTNGWDPVYVYAQSRKQVISPEADNFGFARWVRENAQALADGLGPGVHFGEWWGKGIQRGYGLEEKRFSLFNTARWHPYGPDEAQNDDHLYRCVECPVCHVVPTLAIHGRFKSHVIEECMWLLRGFGSYASPGFMNPEGIVVYHSAANVMFKATLENDSIHKGLIQT